MNKKVLGIAVVLMVVAMLAVPVMAKSPKKIPVELRRSGWDAELYDLRITPGNVAHGRDGSLTWDDYNIIDIQNIVEAENMSCLGGFYEMFGKYEVNLNNPGTPVTTPFGPGILGTGHIMQKVEIDFGSGNTFKGIMTTRGTIRVITGGPFAGAYGLYDGISRSVLQGTGEYQGWTLIWEREKEDGNPGYVYWDAYMLIP